MDKIINYIPIDKLSDAVSDNNTTITGLFVKTVIIIIIILGFVLISYLILSKFTGRKVEKMEVETSSTVTVPQHINGSLDLHIDQTDKSTIVNGSITSINQTPIANTPTTPVSDSPTTPITPTTPATLIAQSDASTSAQVVTNATGTTPPVSAVVSAPVKETPEQIYGVKTTYSKLQEITNPSSLDGQKGYISRDKVCYRYKAKDDAFVKKRFGCIACQVDNRQNIAHNYHGTNTNVVATCVYAKNEDPSDYSIWTREKCISTCSNNPDLKDITQ